MAFAVRAVETRGENKCRVKALGYSCSQKPALAQLVGPDPMVPGRVRARLAGNHSPRGGGPRTRAAVVQTEAYGASRGRALRMVDSEDPGAPVDRSASGSNPITKGQDCPYRGFLRREQASVAGGMMGEESSHTRMSGPHTGVGGSVSGYVARRKEKPVMLI